MVNPVDRHLLPRTYTAFFGRFSKLTPIQAEAIPLIAAGKDVLLCSATASGKTEAFAAPAAEKTLNDGPEAASVLIVSPTRALANDLKRRLDAPMHHLELTFGRYTGEHKKRVGGKLPSVVVTTPESLDSLLTRRPEVLAKNRTIILDEIHVLDNTPRGDHLRVLLHRLGQVTGAPIQKLAASATVDEPEALAKRYLESPEIVLVPGVRRILGRCFQGQGQGAMVEHLNALAGHGFKKVLVFCRARQQVEDLSTALKHQTRYQERVFAHHGSMARQAREQTERLFLEASSGVCFATLTLEMGIDIGTVDYVLLAALPADVASLLQRIGRGSRRGDTTRAGFAVETPAEKHLFMVMFRAAKEGHLLGRPYGFRPAVLCQQALGFACAQSKVTANDLFNYVPKSLRSNITLGTCGDILDGLVEKEKLEVANEGAFVPSEDTEKLYNMGKLHSNFGAAATISVIDRLTGDVIGHVESADGQQVGIGGRSRQLVKTTEDRILTDASSHSTPARFRPARGPSVSMAQGRVVAQSMGVAKNAIGIATLNQETLLVHGMGSAGSLLLRSMLGMPMGRKVLKEMSPYVLNLASSFREPEPITDDQFQAFITQYFASLEKLTSPALYVNSMPRHLRERSMCEILGLGSALDFLNQAKFEPFTPTEEMTDILLSL